MSAPRWEHPNAGLQIAGGGGGAPTTAYQQLLAAVPKGMARNIQESPLALMGSYQAGRQSLARASGGDINKLLIEQKIIDQPVTIEGGETQTLALNPYNKERWKEKDYGTRNATIKDLAKNDPKQDKYLRSFESAWTEETPVTTASAPTELTDELTIGS